MSAKVREPINVTASLLKVETFVANKYLEQLIVDLRYFKMQI